MSARHNTGNAPIRRVVDILDSIDKLECGHLVEQTFRDNRHVTRRRCPLCPTTPLGERADDWHAKEKS